MVIRSTLLLPSTVYMQQCLSGCAGQSKILTVLLLAGWNGYSTTLSIKSYILISFKKKIKTSEDTTLPNILISAVRHMKT